MDCKCIWSLIFWCVLPILSFMCCILKPSLSTPKVRKCYTEASIEPMKLFLYSIKYYLYIYILMTMEGHYKPIYITSVPIFFQPGFHYMLFLFTHLFISEILNACVSHLCHPWVLVFGCPIKQINLN